MSQCVPSWDLEDTHNSSRLTFPPYSTPPNISTMDYEVAELTWENGQLAMHGLGPPRALGKPPPFSTTKYNNNTTTTWDKPRADDTLESIVNQVTTNKIPLEAVDLVPWFDHHRSAVAAAATAAAAASPLAMDALVPSSSAAHKRSVVHESSRHVPDPVQKLGGASTGGGCSTRVESCSGAATIERGKTVERAGRGGGCAKRARAARVPTSGEQSASASATFGDVTLDTCDLELDAGFGSTSVGGSLDNTTTGNPSPSYTKPTTVDDHDSVAHSRPQRKAGFVEDKKKGQNRKSSVSTKRSRAAAIHNQSERKRRDKINQKMKTLQKLVPNSSKTDKASMLDEVIEYIKQLQAQVQMISRLNMPHMMMPMTLQQLQMSLMARMSMGMGMGLMDMNPIGHHHPNIAAIPPILNPAATFMPMTSWDGTSDRLPPSSAPVLPDPLSAFLACQTQQMRMDTYNRIASLYQQVHQAGPPVPTSKT